jgi:hypothetical protein
MTNKFQFHNVQNNVFKILNLYIRICELGSGFFSIRKIMIIN